MMITLKDFMEATNYRITEGSTYGWSCYGNHAYMIDSSCDIDKHSFTVVFDTESQEVYEATAYDYINDRAYRMINPEFVHSHTSESNQRSLNGNEAWEGVMYTELEVVGGLLGESTWYHHWRAVRHTYPSTTGLARLVNISINADVARS